jgi:fructosamine-3-kinase
VSLPPGAGNVRRIAGGDINEAFRVQLADGSEAFVKTRAGAQPGEYAAEAAGLEWLAEPGALRTPRVLEVAEGHLALEWVAPGRLDAAGAEELGRGLAATHLAGAPGFGDFAARRGSGGSGGGSPPARFGWIALSNERARDWPTFLAERRLLPLVRMARERDAVRPRAVAAVERVCARLGELAGDPEAPARLHGDLWSGNVMADVHGRPWLVDPSAYGGHREVDLAMLSLFGSPSPRVLAAYGERAPLATGWQERVELYQLLPLLVHALLFGGSYGAAAERVALRYGG